MIRIYAALLSLMVIVPAASGLEVRCTPGSLAAMCGTAESSLTVSGSIDARDLFFMADSMPQLRVLDLSAATIEAYDGNALHGMRHYPAAMLPDGIFAGWAISSVVLPAQKGMIIGEAAFEATALRELSLPHSVSAVGMGAFAACDSLVSVSLAPDAAYGSHVFRHCRALETADIAGCAAIADAMFAGCVSLNTVGGTESLAAIGDDAFQGCRSLSTFVFPDQPCAIGEGAFMNSGLAGADLAGAGSVGRLAFFGCGNLENTIIGATLDSVGDYSFAGTATRNIDAANLRSVPATGRDVWRGVAKDGATLTVDESMLDAFENAPQWRDFHIITVGATDEVAATAAITAAIDNEMLVITAGGTDISAVDIYSVDGALLGSYTPQAPRCALSLRLLPKSKVIIIAVALADGSKANIKIAA